MFKKLILSIPLLLVSTLSFSQKIHKITSICNKTNKERNSRIGEIHTIGDTTTVSLSTYGPCDTNFSVKASPIQEQNFIKLTFNNLNGPREKIDCACMFNLTLILTGIKDLKQKNWLISNNTMTNQQWEKWYWDNL